MSFIINDELLDEIRSRGDIVDLISEYVNLKRSGTNFMGLCPFHGEKTPSFSVSRSKQIFKCFGCGAGGDIITFVMKKENLNFREAVKFLADKYNIELKEGSKPNKEMNEKIERAYSANREAAKFFMENLSSSKVAYNYLKNRNISNEIISKFGLGYAKDDWQSLYNRLKKLNFTDDELIEFNLCSKSSKGDMIDRFRNRIMFPIIDTKKRVIGFGGRVLDDSLPKYLNTRDTIVFNKGKNLYNLNLVSRESDREKIILVEGYMDVISLYKSGIKYIVASLGTSLTQDQASLIKRYGKEVYICYDGDSPGIKATNRAIDVLIGAGVSPKIISLRDNLDPDEYIKKYGNLSFEMEIQNSISYLTFKISNLKKNYNLDSSEGLSGFTTEVAKIISRVKNPIKRDIYIAEVEKNYGVSKDAIINYIRLLNNEIKKKNFKKSRFENKNFKFNKLNFTNRSEDLLIKYSLVSCDYFEFIKDNISSHEFSNTYSRLVFEELIQNNNEDLDYNSLKNYLINNCSIDSDYLNSLDFLELDLYNYKNVIIDLISGIKTKNLKKRREDILKEIESLDKGDSSKDIENIQTLLKELGEINIKLES